MVIWLHVCTSMLRYTYTACLVIVQPKYEEHANRHCMQAWQLYTYSHFTQMCFNNDVATGLVFYEWAYKVGKLTLISYCERRWYPGRVEISGWFTSPPDSAPSLLLSRLGCLPLLYTDFPSLKDDPGSLLSLKTLMRLC